MVGIIVDNDNTLLLKQGKRWTPLRSATIEFHPAKPKPYEITAFLKDAAISKKKFRQKTFDKRFIPLKEQYVREFEVDKGMTKYLYAENKLGEIYVWHVNYYEHKE